MNHTTEATNKTKYKLNIRR